MTLPAADVHGDRPAVAGLAATMTVVAMGLGYSITAADPTILSANISEIRAGLHMSPSTASFVASLATLTLAAAVLGAGALGDVYGMRRMFTVGLFGTIVFGVLAAAAPNVAVLIVARAGAGIAFAFVLGLSLALINAVFPPERRAAAIAFYLGMGYALTTPMPALGSVLAEHIGWRTGFLVAPVAALTTLAIVWRFVPDTLRAPRRLDGPGLVLVAVALLALVYGISQLQGGPHAGALVPIATGVVAAVAFVVWENRTPGPGSGPANLPLRPIQRRGGRWGDVQFRDRRVDNSVRLLSGHRARRVAGNTWSAARACHVLQAFAATGSGRAAREIRRPLAFW